MGTTLDDAGGSDVTTRVSARGRVRERWGEGVPLALRMEGPRARDAAAPGAILPLEPRQTPARDSGFSPGRLTSASGVLDVME